ncbi:helix-turn-helix transcriptional regulator [Streptomyces sp. NRRL S-1868]|uniref:helix-turn-helix transcriptional regulator n=1 Tax=Streptomyces sp. NRRL S-1868 TaxID=1463892 RepID=UPI0004C8687C|nr:hypothetical protein [Streptomyces sp. NRRL S-1868]
MTSSPPPGLLFIEDSTDTTGQPLPGIASRLGIKPSTYRKWRMAGKGPDTFVLGKRVVARIEAIDAYIADLERTALSPSRDARPPEPRRLARAA